MVGVEVNISRYDVANPSQNVIISAETDSPLPDGLTVTNRTIAIIKSAQKMVGQVIWQIFEYWLNTGSADNNTQLAHSFR